MLTAGSDLNAAARNALSHTPLPDLLAPHFFLHLPPRSLHNRRSGFDSGLLRLRVGRAALAAGQSGKRAVPFPSPLVAAEFSQFPRPRATRKKRGGEVEFVAWDDWMAEAPSHLSLSKRALETATPERLFDIRWRRPWWSEPCRATRRVRDPRQATHFRCVEQLPGFGSNGNIVCGTRGEPGRD